MKHSKLMVCARVAAVAAALAFGASASAQGIGGSEVGAFRMGASLGLFASSFSTGIQVRGDGVYTIQELLPQLYLEGAGHIAIMLGSNSISVYEAVPKVRLRFAPEGPLSVYADLGLGLAILHLSIPEVQVPLPGGGFTTTGGSNNTVSAVFRFSGGLQYAVRPNVAVTLEPLGLNVYTASGSGFAYTLLGGVLFRF